MVPSVMLSQAAQMKKVMPAPIKNIPQEQLTSTMVTLGKSKLVCTEIILKHKLNSVMSFVCLYVCMYRDSSITTQLDNSRKASSKSPVDYFADDVDL